MRVDYSYRSREIDLYGAACWNWLTKIEIDSDFYSAPAYVIIVSGVRCWVDWNTARSASNLVPASGWNLNRLSSHVAILVPDSGDHVCLVLADCVGVLDINLSEVTWWATNIDNYVVDVRESKAVIIVATVAVYLNKNQNHYCTIKFIKVLSHFTLRVFNCRNYTKLDMLSLKKNKNVIV